MESRRSTAWFIWGAILMSVVMYAGLIFGIEVKAMTEATDVILLAFAAAALPLTGLALAATRNVFTPQLKNLQHGLDPSTQPAWLTARIVSFAFAESVGVLGLVYYFMTADQGIASVFLGWSALMLVVVAPRR